MTTLNDLEGQRTTQNNKGKCGFLVFDKLCGTAEPCGMKSSKKIEWHQGTESSCSMYLCLKHWHEGMRKKKT